MKKNCDAVVGQLNHLIQTTNHHWEVIKAKKIEFEGEIDPLDWEWTGDSFVFKLSRGNDERNHMDISEVESWESLTTELGVDFWVRIGRNRHYGKWSETSMDFGWGHPGEIASHPNLGRIYWTGPDARDECRTAIYGWENGW